MNMDKWDHLLEFIRDAWQKEKENANPLDALTMSTVMRELTQRYRDPTLRPLLPLSPYLVQKTFGKKEAELFYKDLKIWLLESEGRDSYPVEANILKIIYIAEPLWHKMDPNWQGTPLVPILSQGCWKDAYADPTATGWAPFIEARLKIMSLNLFAGCSPDDIHDFLEDKLVAKLHQTPLVQAFGSCGSVWSTAMAECWASPMQLKRKHMQVQKLEFKIEPDKKPTTDGPLSQQKVLSQLHVLFVGVQVLAHKITDIPRL